MKLLKQIMNTRGFVVRVLDVCQGCIDARHTYIRNYKSVARHKLVINLSKARICRY